jgi:glycerophosphoryl diester phosphodiesterase
LLRHPEPVLAIAHRSGNTVAGLREALDLGVDLVEADVHDHRGVLEMRHHKNLGPRHLWEKWEVVARRDFPQVELAQVLDELGGDPRLMIDLKGTRPDLAAAVSELLRARAPGVAFTVCTKQWGMLDAFDPVVRRVLSVANRTSLVRLRRRLALEPAYGVSVRLRLLTPEIMAELRTRTDLVMAWSVDTPEALAHARRLGVDAVISKNLDLLAGVIADR